MLLQAVKNGVQKSIAIIKQLVIKHNVEVVSLGNGTASRESEEILAQIIKELKDRKFKRFVLCYSFRSWCICLFGI